MDGKKWWSRDPRDLTILEYMHTPYSIARYKQVLRNTSPPYAYFDTPDGQDIDKKLWVSTKWGGSAGLFFALIDNRLYSNPTTIFGAVNRAAYFVVPLTGMFVTFTAVTYTATSLRGKDSPLNHAIGGAVAGSLAGVWMKSGEIGLLTALIVGLFGACRKYSHEIGHEFFQHETISTVYGSHRTPFVDSSLTKLGERGWTTGKE